MPHEDLLNMVIQALVSNIQIDELNLPANLILDDLLASTGVHLDKEDYQHVLQEATLKTS